MRLLVRLAAAAVLLAVGAGGSAGPAPGAAGPWLLAYRLAPGTTMRYRVAAEISGAVPLPTSPEPVQANAVVTLVYRVSAAARRPDGAAAVQLRVESVDIELEKIPFTLPLEQAQKYLDRDIALSPTGEVVASGEGAEALKLSVPGVDPQRLYTLLFPVVFPARPVRVGDTWPFESGLLGGKGAPATFEALVLKPAAAVAPRGRRSSRSHPSLASARPLVLVPVRERFNMQVDQMLGADKAPAAEGTSAQWHRTGSADGSGVLQFDHLRGRLARGLIDLNASMLDKRLGDPPKDGPSEVASKVKARIRIELLPPKVQAGARAAQRTKEK